MELNEHILKDDYPVYYSYCYVCDGKVRISPIQGNVRQLKAELKVKEVKSCDIVGRELF